MSKQRLRLWGAVMALGVLLTTVGCSERDDTPFGMIGDAEVHLSVGLDQSENEQAISKTVQPTIDPGRDLSVYIINTHADTLARWVSLNAVPHTLKFTPGAYKIVAEYKPVGTKVPSFDTYIYRAEEKFVIKSKDNLQIDLLVKLATAKISVEFDPSFDFYYSSYSVDVRTVGVDSLRFGKTEKRSGFFEPGSVRMRFNLVTREGQTITFSPEPLAKAGAADYYKLKLRVTSDQGNTTIVVEGTNGTLNPEKPIEIVVPKYFLPKDQPTITETIGFVSGVEQNLFEGAKAAWSMKATVPGGLSKFIIRLNDGANGVLGSKLGGKETEIDLASLPEGHSMRDKLKAAGFVWCEGLNSPEDAAISTTNIWVDFTDVMVAGTDGNVARYNFQFEITDNYEQMPEVGPCVVKAEIKTPTVTFVEPVSGNIWATKADFTVKANYDLNTGTHPVLQYRKASSSTWNNAVEGESGDLTVSAGTNDGVLYVAGYELRELQPGTEYEFRVVANDRVIAPSKAVWTTEQALGMPGLSADGGFAGGWNTQAKVTDLGVSVEAPPAGWATRNVLTTSQRALSVNPVTGSGSVVVSDVSAHNGTLLINNPGNVYRKAVQLRTTGWGQGSYSNEITENPGKIYAAGPMGKGGSVAQGSAVRNTSAGILYLGTYTFDPASLSSKSREYVWYERVGDFLGGDKVAKRTNYFPYDQYNGGENLSETGAAFGSRPTALNFQYKFTPSADGTPKEFLIRAEVYASDGTKIGGVSWINGTAVDKMSNHGLKIAYTDVTKKAALLKVFFSSDARTQVGTPDGGPDYTKMTDGSLHIGNQLWIDNVTLGYDF